MKCCQKWIDCKHIERNGNYLPIEYCPQCGSFLAMTNSFAEIKGAIYYIIKKFGGGSDILSIIGGWRDTIQDIEVLTMLKAFLKSVSGGKS